VKDEETAPVVTSRQAIMDATVAYLLKKPFEKVSMAEIAEAAGVSRRTIFNQFDTKLALFEEALKQVWSRIPMAAITQAETALDDPRATLRAVGTAIITFWGHPDAIDIARMVIREGVQYPALTTQYIEMGKRPVTAALIAYLDRANRAGLMPITNPDLAAKQFIGMINEPLVFLGILGVKEKHTPEYRAYVVEEAVTSFFLRYPLAVK
jgi:AcrR family transcriptional regulator